MDRPQGTQDKLSADAARRIAARRAQRAASLARRAAAARRRAALTVALLALTAIGWAVVGLTSIAIAAAVVPTGALAGVLVLGRRAVVHAHAADAAWAQQPRSTAGVLGAAGTSAPVRPVLGMAHHPSDSMTEVIARVRDDAPPAAVETVSSHRPGSSTAPSAAQGERERPVADKDRTGAVGTNPAELEEWVPVPVPRPTYTIKAEAPRREPIPLVLDDPEVSAAVATATSSEGDDQGELGRTGGPADLESAGSTPDPTLDLDVILARRRNVG